MNNRRSWKLFSERIETPKGPDIVDLELSVEADGKVRIDGVYAGPNAEAFWGDWDHEFWLIVPASHATDFLALIARDAFTREGRLKYSDLVALCREAEVPIEEGHWT